MAMSYARVDDDERSQGIQEIRGDVDGGKGEKRGGNVR